MDRQPNGENGGVDAGVAARGTRGRRAKIARAGISSLAGLATVIVGSRCSVNGDRRSGVRAGAYKHCQR